MAPDGESEVFGSVHDPLGERTVLRRGRRFDFEVVRSASPSGAVHVREIVRHPGAVVILPLLEDGRVVMIRNHRIAVGGWVLELPAGTIERGEAAAACAARELEEETGRRAGELVELGSFLTTPGMTDELMHAFVALRCEETRASLDPDERIEVEVVTQRGAMGMLERGELRDAKSMLALLLAERAGLLSR